MKPARPPKMDVLLLDHAGVELVSEYGRAAVKTAVGRVLEEARSRWRGGGAAPSAEDVLAAAANFLKESFSRQMHGVVNATGIVLHTNLGRAVLRRKELEEAVDLFSGYVDLELDLDRGTRNNRDDRLESSLRELLGTDYGALLVNNNAAAVLLALNTLSSGKEAVVSRGELVEIGGGFRIPEVMEASGARMKEIGTTNRTRISDYLSATGRNTALYLKVHPSNFRVVGFSQQPSVEEIVSLGRQKKIPVLYDLGSGLMLERGVLDLGDEPGVKEALAVGPDVVCFSTDKLLGACQGGILLVAPKLRERFKKNPLLRALRADKLAYYFVERAVDLYRRGQWREIPTLASLVATDEELFKRSVQLKNSIDAAAPGFYDTKVGLRSGKVGGGTAPVFSLVSPVLSIKPLAGSESELDEYVRKPPTPILGTRDEGYLNLHLRTVLDGQESLIVNKLSSFARR